MSTFNPAIYYPIYSSMIATSNASKYSSGDISHPVLLAICCGVPMILVLLSLGLSLMSMAFDWDIDDICVWIALVGMGLLLFGTVIWIIAEAISYIF